MSQRFDPELLALYDRYAHGQIDRRGFLDGAARFAAAGGSAAALLAALSPDYARGEQVAAGDPRIVGQRESFASPQGSGQGRGLLVRPAQASGRLPAVLVIHENRGLTPHIEDVARRVALAGYLAFAPDALAPLGGYPGDEDQARQRFAQLDRGRMVEDMVAAARHLHGHERSNGRLGAMGFCFGGGLVNVLATRLPELAAAVPFYGPAPALADVPRIRARLLIHLAERDDFVNPGYPAYEAALKAAGVRYEIHRYAGAQHAFHNDTTPRYDADAARRAWDRTLAFLQATLEG